MNTVQKVVLLIVMLVMGAQTALGQAAGTAAGTFFGADQVVVDGESADADAAIQSYI